MSVPTRSRVAAGSSPMPTMPAQASHCVEMHTHISRAPQLSALDDDVGDLAVERRPTHRDLRFIEAGPTRHTRVGSIGAVVPNPLFANGARVLIALDATLEAAFGHTNILVGLQQHAHRSRIHHQTNRSREANVAQFGLELDVLHAAA